MDKKLLVNIKNYDEVLKVLSGTTLLEISKRINGGKNIYCLAKVNNELQELHRIIEEDSVVEFLDITDSHGFRAYQRSVSFMMICATKEILGSKTRIVIEHSINKDYYCEIFDDNVFITDQLLERIEARMFEIMEEDLPIEKLSITIERAEKLSEKFGLYDKLDILRFRRTSRVSFYKLSWFYDYFYGQLVPSTGLLKKFKLIKQNVGFILQFPDFYEPTKMSEHQSFEKISSVFLESSQWARILNIDTVGSLNKRICEGDLGNIIRIAEALHEKKIAEMADMIHFQNKRVVLIAGPSSSGKTTFSHRLSIQLKVNGLRSHIISIDDYFKDQKNTPGVVVDEEFDFESIEAIDHKLLCSHLMQLLKGETVNIPAFNFVTGKREDKSKYKKIEKNDVLIVEGIHGLNDKVTEGINPSLKFKIFISALTQLNVDDHNRIATTDTRLLRRIVRDSQFRKLEAVSTIKMWPKVTKGETENIFPYQEQADAILNSSLVYELCILKPYVEPILFNIDKSNAEYADARRLVKFLDAFLAVSSEEVPKNSILREFIGGSVFD